MYPFDTAPSTTIAPNLRRSHINICQIRDIHYSDRNLVSFLIHISYEAEIRSQLCKFNITVRDDFNPLDPTLVNKHINCKVQHTRKAFLYRICVALQQFKTPTYNTIANFFVQSGLINFEDLASYDLAPPYKYRTGHILDHA